MSDKPTSRPELRSSMRRLQHDLRTPIGQILGYGELLREEAADGGLDHLIPDLDKIDRAARQLMGVLDQHFGRAGESDSAARIAEGSAAAHADATHSETFPSDAASGELAQPRSTPDSGGRVLVVDDDPGNRELLARRLEQAGHSVRLADSGAEALHLVWNEPIDLVLLDVIMPEMDGLQVLRSIRSSRPAAELPVIMATALERSEDVVRALRQGASDYVTKPFDMPSVLARVATHLELKRANDEVASLALRLEIHTRFVRQTFGRYLSEDVVAELLDKDAGLDLQGEKRTLTVLMADLRGFSALTSELGPAGTVAMLNNHLGTMAEVIEEHGGMVDAFLGDGILALFGAPQPFEDHAARAVSCAIAMQLAMPGVNARNHNRGLPPVEMGIGLASGEVVIGNIGSERRAKYSAIGSPVNLAARVESFSTGGEIWLSPSTVGLLKGAIDVDLERVIHPKGFADPLSISRVIGIRGDHARTLPTRRNPISKLEESLAVRFSVLEGKGVKGSLHRAEMIAASAQAATLRAEFPVAEMSDLRIELLDRQSQPIPGACYAKVIEVDDDGQTFLVRFTSRSEAFEQLDLAAHA